jgi:Fe(3+) dicitrate transport protein
MSDLAIRIVCLGLVLEIAVPAAAQEGSGPDQGSTSSESDDYDDDDDWNHDLDAGEIVVRHRADDVFDTPGSVHVVGEEELEDLDYNDPLAVLVRVPGVYVRQEEGFGLRPNIGLRGANAERSRKITLLEDGVLMAPAPYSAPAAYYFPLVARMTSIEVSMGPSAIVHGPNTIGGAIDFRGRAIPARREGRIDLALGNTWYGRVHLHYGDSNEWGGFLVEAIHLRSSGFRELDQGARDDDTGFHRTDILARGELHGSLSRDVYHRLEATFGLGLEQSNETYLGLTDSDFRATPYRRYASTQLDRMAWWRTRAQLRYQVISGEDFELNVIAYRHDFERTWTRLDRFCDRIGRAAGSADDAPFACSSGPGLDLILGDPTGARGAYYEILSGIADSDPSSPLRMLLVHNHRTFAAQGIQAAGTVRLVTGDFAHRAQVGARVHYDDIHRDHTGDGYLMIAREMIHGPEPALTLDRNFASSWALSLYATWAITWRGLTITPGVRSENVWMVYEDALASSRQTTEQLALLPGIGAQYEITRDLAVFAGAHLGFSPVAPGQIEGTLPETAWNYEVGGRYGRITDLTRAQATFFVSDYQNLTGQCSGAGGGCGSDAIDTMFNVGAATILGIEAEAAHTLAWDEIAIPLRASYTWTWTRLRSAFTTDSALYADVRPGDRLPYVPEHQLTASTGVEWRMLELNVSGTYLSAMRDTASQGAVDRSGQALPFTDEFFMLDATATVEVTPGFRVYLRGENLTDARPIVSRRPWGARSGKPVLVQGGIQIDIR